MATAQILHLLPRPPVADPPDVGTIISASTPTAGILTTRLLDPALPALGAAQVLNQVKGTYNAPKFIYGRWLTRPLPAQTIGAGSWTFSSALRTPGVGGLAYLGVGITVAVWRPGAGVITRLIDAAVYPASVQTIATTGVPTGGTFTVTWNSSISGAIAFNASAANIATLLNAMSGITTAGGVACAGGPLPAAVTVTFNVGGPQILFSTSVNSLTGGSVPAPVYASTPPAAGTAAALIAGVTQVADFATLSTLTGISATLLANDCLILEVWSTGSVSTGTAAYDLSLLSNGLGQFFAATYPNGSLTDTDCYLRAPAPITFS